MRSHAASVVRASATPCPLMAASITMLARLSTGPCVTAPSSTPASRSQLLPVRAAIQVDQRKLQDVGGLAEPTAAGQQLRAAHGKQLFRRSAAPHRARASCRRRAAPQGRPPRAQSRRDAAWPRRAGRCRNVPQRNGRAGAPAIWRRSPATSLTVSTPAFWRCKQPFGADRNAIERIAHDREIVAAGLRDDQALALAIEQLDAELRLPAP